MIDIDRAKDIHGKLAQAGALLAECLGLALQGVSKEQQFRPDVYASLGETAGYIRKARGLIAREIDDAT